MRHGKKFNHLGRKSAHRKAMLSNMAGSLIEHKRIVTTLAKAKALRVYVEPLITKSKEDTTHNRRTAFRYLQNKFAVSELFGEVAQKVADRPGGYTRIIKLGTRKGDNAEIAMIELVDFNDLYVKEGGKKKRRRRRGGKKDSDVAVATETATDTAEEVVDQVEDAVETVEDDVATDEQIEETAAEVAEEIEDQVEETAEETTEEPAAEATEEVEETAEEETPEEDNTDEGEEPGDTEEEKKED